MIKKTPTWLIRLFVFQYATNINEGFFGECHHKPTTFWPLWWRISLSIKAQITTNHGHGRFVKWRFFAHSTVHYKNLTYIVNSRRWSVEKIVPREGEFLLLMVFEVNCSPLDLSSDLLGHKAEFNLVWSVESLSLSQSSGQVRHVENKEKNSNIFRGNYANPNIH